MTWWTRLLRRRKLDQDLDEEIRTHLKMAAQDRIARGQSDVSAESNARREFGNRLLVKETARDVWIWRGLEKFGQDLRYILRQMRRSPGFTAVAVLTLTLGLLVSRPACYADRSIGRAPVRVSGSAATDTLRRHITSTAALRAADF